MRVETTITSIGKRAYQQINRVNVLHTPEAPPAGFRPASLRSAAPRVRRVVSSIRGQISASPQLRRCPGMATSIVERSSQLLVLDNFSSKLVMSGSDTQDNVL